MRKLTYMAQILGQNIYMHLKIGIFSMIIINCQVRLNFFF